MCVSSRFPRLLTLAVTCLAIALLPQSGLAAESPATPAEPQKETPAAKPAPKSPVGFVKGYTWGWTGVRGTWAAPEAAQSMKELADTGTQWASIAFLAHMNWGQPEIMWGEKNPRMITDDEIRHAIALARENKLKVILKPVIDPLNAPKGKWRGLIEFPGPDGKPDPGAWKAWFANYTAFLLHYAAIAQEARCEMLCVACEMRTMEPFETEWRELIRRVRQVYKGPLVYNGCLETMWDVRWWDAVDILGVSAYSWRPNETDNSVEALVAYWTKWRDGMRALAAKTARPILFIEIGCRSARGASTMSGDFTHWEWPYDGREQAHFYEAAFRVFWDEPWFCGYSWWDWPAKLYPRADGEKNKEFLCYGKPAEQVLRQWYAKPRP